MSRNPGKLKILAGKMKFWHAPDAGAASGYALREPWDLLKSMRSGAGL